jgi:hypothetical protein
MCVSNSASLRRDERKLEAAAATTRPEPELKLANVIRSVVPAIVFDSFLRLFRDLKDPIVSIVVCIVAAIGRLLLMVITLL